MMLWIGKRLENKINALGLIKYMWLACTESDSLMWFLHKSPLKELPHQMINTEFALETYFGNLCLLFSFCSLSSFRFCVVTLMCASHAGYTSTSLNSCKSPTTIMEAWRRIDIDALEPENHLSKQDLVPDLPPTSHDEIVSLALQIRQTLSKGQFLAALQAALDSPPYVAEEATKDLHAETVFEVLASIKNNHNIGEFSKFVSQLTSDEQDTLVKYIYKIMATPYGAKQGGLMLTWFEKTVDVTGMGPVVRHFSDRRTV